jgi:hypothetical protein
MHVISSRTVPAIATDFFGVGAQVTALAANQLHNWYKTETHGRLSSVALYMFLLLSMARM